MKKLRVCVIGHWGGNIGHDIMAFGVEHVLKKAFGNFEADYLEQHRPLEIYPKTNLLPYLKSLRHARGGRVAQVAKNWLNRPDISRLFWRFSWVGAADFGVVCGGPIITPRVSEGDLGLMLHHMLGVFPSKHRPLVNLSLGSCYPWERTSTSIEERDRDFLKKVLDYSSISTVRDSLAQELCAELGVQCELIQDTGFVGGEAMEKLGPGKNPRYIVINYQRQGANESWGQDISFDVWEQTLKNLISALRPRHELIFLCHSEAEVQLANKLDSSIPVSHPKNLKEYAQVISGAIAGVCNRLHAAIPLASIGVPVIGIGTDSRLLTLQAMGIPCFYVKDVNAEMLEHALEDLIANRDTEAERLNTLRETAVQRYVEVVRNATGC